MKGRSPVLAIENDPMASPYSLYGAIKEQAIPEQLEGRSVLDIGGYDGRFAKVCFDRGAAPVAVLDSQEWRAYHGGVWPSPRQFDGISYQLGDFMEREEGADLVLFYNVLYHCKDWLGALPKVRQLTKWRLCLSTFFAQGTGWVGYTDSGPQEQRATPSVPALFRALTAAGFLVYESIVLKGDHIILRCG